MGRVFWAFWGSHGPVQCRVNKSLITLMGLRHKVCREKAEADLLSGPSVKKARVMQEAASEKKRETGNYRPFHDLYFGNGGGKGNLTEVTPF